MTPKVVMATFETLSVVHASWGHLPRLCPGCEGRAHGGVHLINFTTFHSIIDMEADKKTHVESHASLSNAILKYFIEYFQF